MWVGLGLGEREVGGALLWVRLALVLVLVLASALDLDLELELILVNWRKEKWGAWVQIGRDASAFFSDLSFKFFLMHLLTYTKWYASKSCLSVCLI